MECICKVVRSRLFQTKKGRDAREVWVSENNGIPFKVLVWDSVQAKKDLPDGSSVKLYSDVDFNLVGTLNIKW